MSDRPRLSQETFELTEEEISPERLESQMQRAEEQLTVLRRQQELVERQKRELEELSRRQDQLQQGRADLIEKFTRTLVVIEREQLEIQRRSEMLQSVRESFSSHLHYFESLDLREFEGNDLNRELTRALSALDDARTEFTRTLPRISIENPEAADASTELSYSHSEFSGSFNDWLRNGVAFTLPLVVVGLLIFFALLLSPRH